MSFTLPPDVLQLLQAHCLRTGQSADEVAAQAVRQALLPKIYVNSPIISLVHGLISANTTVGECLALGNFGLGTLNMLDGELLVLDGVAYQLAADGSSHVVPPTAETPYMVVADFDPAHCKEVTCKGTYSHHEFMRLLAGSMATDNSFYAVKVTGTFQHVRARAVPKQETLRPLVEVAAQQTVFEFHNEEHGVLAGFWSPDYLGAAINVPQFHLHFISNDRQRGGHLLECTVSDFTVQMMEVPRILVDLPSTLQFKTADMGRRRLSEDIQKAEH